MGFINRKVRGKNIDLGRIDLMQNFSFFEVPEDQTGDILHFLNGTEFDGRKVNVEVTNEEGKGKKEDGGRKKEDGKRKREEGKKKKEEGRRKRDEKPSHPKGAKEWAKYFEGQVEAQPFYNEFAKKKKKKK